MTGLASVHDGIESYTKRCPSCRHTLPVERFAVATDRASGRSSWCKDCINRRGRTRRTENPEKYALDLRRQSERYHANEGIRKRKRMRKVEKQYGLSPDAHAEMLASQNGCCAICECPSPGGRGDWHVDHCHVTGEVRGLLCQRCNTRLGVIEVWFLPLLPKILNYLKVNA